MLIIVSGLPGTGKTTFAQALATRLQAQHLNSDRIRDELHKRGRYDPDTKAKIYEELRRRTGTLLEEGKTVIVDATFHLQRRRQPFIDLASEGGWELKWIEITAPEALIRERVGRKRAYSEADFEVYQRIRAAAEPLQVPHLRLTSGEGPLEAMVDRAVAYLKPTGK